ncbi:hypothetical protein POM88_006048 [Heracleum sosnowskyi]|uniref:C2H2-type domain-containing protein n=1 Tax=Heracleum sosnowskyi TaxID=360622 RepID=A0AAD8J1V2_9APIA|nr:hypothetical protein POM88_006048 [Heracleum sosnowskyi]
MTNQTFQQSPSSQSSASSEMKGNDDLVQPKSQPISNAPPQLLEQPINEEEPEAKKTFPCRYCNKTFSSSMALGGHQNGHRRQRALAKKKAETRVSCQPYPTNYTRYPNYTTGALNNNFSQGMSTDSMTYNNLSHMSMESSTSSNTWRILAEFYAKMGTKPYPATTYAPPAATSTMFFGVGDFFGDSFAPKTTASMGASGSPNVINLEDEEEEKGASALNLDLKL